MSAAVDYLGSPCGNVTRVPDGVGGMGRDFLLEADPQAAQDTAVLVFDALEILVQHREIGRKVHFGQRELVISRGRTGYLAPYRFLPHIDCIVVLAQRHQRESGYTGSSHRSRSDGGPGYGSQTP